MKILANAYKFVELQLKSVNNVNQNIGEDLEKEFEGFLDGHSPSGKIKYKNEIKLGL